MNLFMLMVLSFLVGQLDWAQWLELSITFLFAWCLIGPLSE